MKNHLRITKKGGMMKSRLKKMLVPFVLMLIFDLGFYFAGLSQNLGQGLNPHVGLFAVSGLLFGPYGALGVVLGNVLCDLIRGYGTFDLILSAVISFGISYLSYKLWYQKFYREPYLIGPRLIDIWHLLKFLVIIAVVGILYASLLEGIFLMSNLDTPNYVLGYRYFLNYVNFSIIFAVIGFWISKRIDFVHLPEISERKPNEMVYSILRGLLVILTIIIILMNSIDFKNNYVASGIFFLTILVMYLYLTKPMSSKLLEVDHNPIAEKIIDTFLLGILLFMIINVLISYWVYVDYKSYMSYNILSFDPALADEISVLILAAVDFLSVLFFIPSFIVLTYVKKDVVNPIISFSEIENFISEDKKIESDGLLNIYSNYAGSDNEIGVLARSYTDLIKYNNYYIENIQKIEGEKERIKAELDIATKIQQSNLPTKAIENEFFKVNGYSKAAKEVGGDFFDYYELDDENLAIVIGDASGKGVPAALLATITQAIIKQMLQHESDPSKILYTLNNQLYENNSEFMFITLWLAIYNRTTNSLTFSNAGHNPPLVRQNGSFEYFEIDEGIVLGIMEDYEFKKEEIVLTDEIVAYTDGITDANNANNEMYGEEKLKDFFNNLEGNVDPIKPLLEDIGNFVSGCEQFDDMTLLYLRINND